MNDRGESRQMKAAATTHSLIATWVKLIRPLFPKNARIEITAGADVVLRIDWKLGTDPSRPHKRSRLIRVIISEEAIGACTDFEKAGSRFRNLIENRLSTFHPEHSTPRCGTPPREEWIVASQDVNR
jgi:hypothetical protein